jgi:hypothetical protein
VVQVYHAAGAAIRGAANHPVPIKQLVDFDRVSLDAGDSTTLSFVLSEVSRSNPPLCVATEWHLRTRDRSARRRLTFSLLTLPAPDRRPLHWWRPTAIGQSTPGSARSSFPAATART